MISWLFRTQAPLAASLEAAKEREEAEKKRKQQQEAQRQESQRQQQRDADDAPDVDFSYYQTMANPAWSSGTAPTTPAPDTCSTPSADTSSPVDTGGGGFDSGSCS